jgi:hypothetical protein
VNDDTDLADVHQRYVNAERGDGGIPDYYKERLNNDIRNELLKETVFRELWYSDKPIHSLGSLQSSFSEDRETVRSRLDEMVEQGILKKGSINNGDYWWIYFPYSEYPLPKDVIVHPQPESEDLTVSEFVSQLHVVIGIVALFATAVGGAVVLFGVFQQSGNSILPISTEEIIRTGLLTLFGAYIFLFLAIVIWIVERAFAPKGEDSIFIFKND